MSERLKTMITESPAEKALTVAVIPQVFEYMTRFPLKVRSLVVLQAVPVKGQIST